MQHEGNQCNLNDRFAHPTGVLNCLREDAADIGFVDHWTAWGAGQAATQNQNATLRNMSELKAVCNDGCRNLIEAIEVRQPCLNVRGTTLVCVYKVYRSLNSWFGVRAHACSCMLHAHL